MFRLAVAGLLILGTASVVTAQETFSHGPGPYVWPASLTPTQSRVPMPWLRAVSVTA